MTHDKTEPKRIILPPKKRKVSLETSSIIPATELLLHDAKAIIGAELAHYRSKAVRGVTLDPKERGKGSIGDPGFVELIGYRIAAPSQASLSS